MNGGKDDRVRWVFGVHPVIEVLRARPERVREVLLARRASGRGQEIERLARASDIRIRHVGRRDIEEVAEGVVHQGVAAVVEAEVDDAVCPDPGEPAALVEEAKGRGEIPLILALDGIQDPRNLGALVRSAHALGAHGVVVPKDRATMMTPAAVKSSAGAAAYMPVCRVTNLSRALDDLKRAGLWVVGADAGDPEPETAGGEAGARERGGRAAPRGRSAAPAELDRTDLCLPLVLVIGAEGAGLRRLVRECCDHLVRIPMAGRIGSINASVAGGIVLYEVLRQRRLAEAAKSASLGPFGVISPEPTDTTG